MSALNRDEFMSRLQARIGDDTSDDAMSFIEDMTDTFNDLESRTSGESDAEWQKKYDDLDKSWREKYKARFFESNTSASEVKDEQKKDVIEDGETENVTFDDLFEEREG